MKLTELEKGRIAVKFTQMNLEPDKFNYFKRFIDNEGDVLIPGFDPFTGRSIPKN